MIRFLRRRSVRIGIGSTAAAALLFLVATFFLLPARLGSILKQGSVSTRFDSIRWDGFLSLNIQNLVVANPEESRTALFRVRQMKLRIPPWGILIRPVPAQIRLISPHLVMDAQMGDSLLSQVRFVPMGAAYQNAEEESSATAFSLRSLPLLPIGLKIEDGRLEMFDFEIKQNEPIYRMANLKLDLHTTSALQYPSVHLAAGADFVTQQGKKIGSLDVQIQGGVRLERIEGKVDLWYGRLEDFRTIYHDAPEPLFLEGGAGGPLIEWDYRNGRVKVTLRCRAEGLKISGQIGNVPWQKVLDALADAQGRIDLTLSTEGELQGSDLDLHHRLLSELDWAIKERAAAAGIRIPGRIFYGLAARDDQF